MGEGADGMNISTLIAITLLGAATGGVSAAQYQVSEAGSYLLAVTGKAGLFSFAGHNHAVSATQWTTRLTFDPQDLARSSAIIVIPVSSLVIDSRDARDKAHLGSGPSPEDVKTIQARMLSPEILDASRYPTITFKISSAKENGSGRMLASGDLTLHGVTRPVGVPVNYTREGAGAYVFDGKFKIRQTDFGMQPESVAGGTVKVKDEVEIRFRVSLVPGAR
jgi:polyisoprenoid-binding protein YceI